MCNIRDLNIALLSRWKWSYKTKPLAVWVRVTWAIHHQPRRHVQFPHKVAMIGIWNGLSLRHMELTHNNSKDAFTRYKDASFQTMTICVFGMQMMNMPFR